MFEFFVFTHLVLEKAQGHRRFGTEAGRRKLVEVTTFVVAFDKVLGLYQAFIKQSFEAIVEFAQAHFEFGGQAALAAGRAFFDGFE